MNPELEALLKAWDAYLRAKKGQEADRLLERYDAQLEEVCCRTKVGKEILDRAVQCAYQRWQWADAPKFPHALRKSKLE
ncbi:MAG: hypothetical protein HY735_07475 [Verrucomicrobia bacterium]|nr:hypothetical protein [Verrucomicrobiota bacterium]